MHQFKESMAADSKQKKTDDKPETTTEQNDQCRIVNEVRNISYFHGFITHADTELALKKEGDFLLRKCEVNDGVFAISLSIRHDEKVKNFRLKFDPKTETYFIDLYAGRTVAGLVKWHISTNTVLTRNLSVHLGRPIERPAWLLDHNSITLIKKLGEGRFGCIYLATHETENKTRQVVVEVLSDEAYRLDFMEKARQMRKTNYKNIVKIVGVAVHEYPLLFVTEICSSVAPALSGYLKIIVEETQEKKKINKYSRD